MHVCTNWVFVHEQTIEICASVGLEVKERWGEVGVVSTLLGEMKLLDGGLDINFHDTGAIIPVPHPVPTTTVLIVCVCVFVFSNV